MHVEVSEGIRRIFKILVGLVVAIALGTAVYAWNEGYPPFGPRDDEWSGVFLTNGQAYFGHFYSAPGEYARLRDVYYVLATQLQPADPRVPVQTQLSLQRLGGEIHGPRPDMRIAKDQILFVEDLRPDSAVVVTIQQLKQGIIQPPQQPAQPPASQQPTSAPASAAPTATPRPSVSPTPTR